MANKISVVIDIAVDRANTALNNFRRSVGDAEGAVGKFKAGAASAGDSLKANIMPVAAAAGTALVAFAAKSVQAASNLSESTNAVNVSFGRAAKGVLEIGENAAVSMGLSQSAFNEAAVGFSAFAETIAGPGGDVADVIGEITTRASDFASTMNLDVAEANNVFRSALSGETEPIKKFGINLSAAAVEAYALATGIVKSKDEITEAVKVQARYGLLLQETDKFAGDFANTSDGLANSSRIAAARFEDLQAKIGTQLLPVVEDATGLLLGLADAIDAVGQNSIVKFGSDLGLFNNVFGVTKDLWDKGPGSLIAMATATDDASTSIVGLSQSMVQESIDAAMVKRKTDDVTAADEAATEAAEAREKQISDNVDALNEITDAQEDARKATEDATMANLEAIDSSLGYRNQTARTKEAIQAANAEMGKAKQGTDEYAQAARDAEGAALTQAAAAVQLAEDQAAANGQTLTAREKTAIYRSELESLAGELNGDAALAIAMHIQRLKQIPTSIQTNVSVQGSASVRRSGSVDGMRASGGPVSPGGAYIVGEKGPELLQMGSMGGNVVPNSALGSGGNTYNITVQGLTGPSVADEIVSKIKEYERRNGPGWRS